MYKILIELKMEKNDNDRIIDVFFQNHIYFFFVIIDCVHIRGCNGFAG